MVTKPALHDTLTNSVRLEAPYLFECAPASQGAVCVNTSLLYPDGGEVQVYVTEQDGEYVVSDYGEAAAWLRMQLWERDLTPQQQSRIDDICRQLGVECEGGRLVTRRPNAEMVLFAVLYVALAAVRVADISYTCGGAG